MAQLTQQQQALSYAALIASYMAQLRTLYGQISTTLTTSSDQSYDGTLENLPTFAFTTQGAQGLFDQTAGSGTVSVANGSALITFSTSQTGLSGSYLVVTGDSANGLYLIGTGSGDNWTLMSPYAGATNASASFGFSAPNTAHPIALPLGGPLQMSRNNVLTANGALANFQAYWTGQAVASQANTPQKFADLLNS